VETGLAASGSPLADGDTERPDSIVHPRRGRIDLTISTTGPLLPNTAVELAIGGVSREPVDSGEVVLTLPTKALMDHVGEGRPDLPAEAKWACGDDDLTKAPMSPAGWRPPTARSPRSRGTSPRSSWT